MVRILNDSANRSPTIALVIVQVWLALGTLAVLCIPSLRGENDWVGSLPLWLIGMPAAEWLLLRWRSVAASSSNAFGHLRDRSRLRRRPISSRRVRAPLPRSATRRARGLLTALLLR